MGGRHYKDRSQDGQKLNSGVIKLSDLDGQKCERVESRAEASSGRKERSSYAYGAG